MRQRTAAAPSKSGTVALRPDEKSSGLFYTLSRQEEMNTKTNEELYAICTEAEDLNEALGQLILNLTPMMVSIGRKHLERLKAYEPDDYIQEGSITLWTLIEKKAYNGKGKVSTLFYTAFERRCANLYRDYVLKNLVQIAEADDLYCNGYNTCIMVEDDYAKAYREKHKEQCRKWAEKNGRVAKEKKPVMTAEEKKAKQRERSKAYYEAHKEHYKELKKKWYEENKEHALNYQKAYDNGFRIGQKGPAAARA